MRLDESFCARARAWGQGGRRQALLHTQHPGARAQRRPVEATPRLAQKLGIIFRGQGKQISEAEIAARHPDVNVRFQPKAWASAPRELVCVCCVKISRACVGCDAMVG